MGEDLDTQKINLTFKVSGGTQFELEVDSLITVLDLKKLAVESSSIPAEEQRLIYKGRILKDADTLTQHKITSGHCMHLVRGAPPPGGKATTPSTESATSGNTTTDAPQSGGATSAATGVDNTVNPASNPIIGLGSLGGLGGMGAMG
eukprot:Filipodium_phascolosomae@DN8214_c0_g1_i1.p1